MKKAAVVLLLVMAVIAAFAVGVWLGPRMQVMRDTWTLERNPDPLAKFFTAMTLAETETGRMVLWNHLESSNKTVRISALAALAQTERPLSAIYVLGHIPAGREDERLETIRALGYSAQHAKVMTVLKYECAHAKDARLKSDIGKELEAIKQGKSAHLVPEYSLGPGASGVIGWQLQK
jgi:hypothetical protein